ncbi:MULTISPECIES: hypothetical protein [Myroides]|uniref:DUF3999 domain-containing protein n=1 Tax=Myroides albus TaxID=2562892 RepID=A0A6I3LNZ5_9FLAO|nr:MULTISPECIES: hypothetical protein [Myroides]MTG97902.1 hypothetical protein [Myroides albus]MVX36566.1 hypothetical protein [Myroides sp. LoEW2-1]UVD81090.1 hypothetical protein NWE55_07525 [Myroides albus]
MKKIYTIALVILSTYFLSTQVGHAQSKTYTTTIAPITESGYYNIKLDNRIAGEASSNFSNLRIMQRDSLSFATTEVPYFIRNVQPTSKETKIIEYQTSTLVERDSINRFVIHNPEAKKVSDFYININKADVSIHASVRGSNDNQSWFIVKQKTPIYTYTSSNDSEVTLFITIPEGRYKYYEMELINNQSAPLKLNKVSTAVDTKTYGQFSPTLLKYADSKVNNKNKTSILYFAKQQYQYRLNKLLIEIDSPKDYYRKAILRDSLTKTNISFILSSKNRNEFILDDILVQNPYIEIYNGDNTPLVVKAVNTYSLTRFATAYLNANTSYTVNIIGDEYDTPEYDIQHFKNDIPSSLPIVETHDFQFNQFQKASPEEIKKANNAIQSIILWGVIIIVGLVIALICYKTFKKQDN